MTDDVFNRLEDMLAVYDWYYAFSENAQIVSAGEQAFGRLAAVIQLAVQTDKKRTKELFEQYRPDATFSYPGL